MQTVYKDTQEAPVKWWAALDAQQRNTVNKTQWSAQVQLKVEQMKMALELLYAGKIYEAYGKRRVAIKVDKAVVRDFKQLREMEQYWAEQGITKTQTPQGLLYQIA
jgi:hypothetical protein